MTDKEKLLAFADSLEWQDIDSAPKDGTRVLVKVGNKQAVMRWATVRTSQGYYTGWVYYGREESFWQKLIGSSGDRVVMKPEYEPTHWKPLPTGEAAEVIRELVKYVAHSASYGSLEAEITLQKAAELITEGGE